MRKIQEQSFWKDRPVFVTGGGGLVGSALVRSLVSTGAEVVCLLRDWVPQSELYQSGELVKVNVVRGDVRDRYLLERILGEYETEIVFHLAAQTIVGIANRNPISTFESNIQGSWSLLESCRRSPKVKGVVIASSDKAYGHEAELPYTESTPLQGRFPYDVSKSCTDLIAQCYAATYNLPVTIARCGNIYGEGDLNWNRIVPGTIRSILKKERPIIRSDGSTVRDYFYVEDSAVAYMILAQNLANRLDLCGEGFNFSYGAPVTTLELVNKILGLMESNLEPDVRNEAQNEIPEQFLDPSKALRTLGWTPRYDFDQGLQRTIAYYRSFLNRTID